MADTPIRVLDLFAGAGGFSAGLHQASPRFQTVAAVEMDTNAAASYEATFGSGLVFAGAIQDWLATAKMPENIDLVVGGPPCQGFSTLGKQDIEDERNELWREYVETIQRVKPKYFIVENVAVFAKSKQYKQFVEATAPGGAISEYGFEHRILNAADFGAPQARKRAVVIGYRRDLGFPGFPEPTHSAHPEADSLKPYVTVQKALARVPHSPDRDGKFGAVQHEFAGKVLAGAFQPRDLHWSRDYSELSLKRFAEIPAGGNRFDIPEELLAPCWVRHRSGSGDVMGRLHLDKPSVTIRTEFFKPEKGRYLHPTEDRAITHYEAALLQGFPDTHRFVGSKTAIARQIGNAVPIPLGAALGRHLETFFSDD
ncbi:MAG: DNA cytosine methyltransferase [Microbacteriaceae bacterium]